MIFFKGYKKGNAYRNLLLIVERIKNNNIDVFDRIESEKTINVLALSQYRLRVFNEAIYLNGVYLDYFNSCRPIKDVCEWYGMTKDNFESLIVTARCCHMILHSNITTIEQALSNGGINNDK